MRPRNGHYIPLSGGGEGVELKLRSASVMSSNLPCRPTYATTPCGRWIAMCLTQVNR